MIGIMQNAFGVEKKSSQKGNDDTTKNSNKTLVPQDTIKSYTCTMHPEITWPKPDKCPKCGMDLVLKQTDQLVKTEYTCSMHPDVISDKPGKCPQCRMDLVIKGTTGDMDMGCMGMMHGNGKKRIWMYIGGAIMVVMMAVMMVFVVK